MTGPNKNIHPGQGGVTYPSAAEFPVSAIAITGITNAQQAIVTAPNHGFTSANIPVTQVDFSQVKGMQEINGKFGYITQIIDVNNFQINLNTLFFYPYISGGYCNINAGLAPYDPFQNTFP